MTLLLLHVLVVVVALLHILLRRHRQPESRAAWMLMVLALPYVGALAYLLVGIGVGLAGTPASHSLTASVPVHRAGMASGTADLQRDLGGAVMQSILGVLLTVGYGTAIASAVANSPDSAKVTDTLETQLQKSFAGAEAAAQQYPRYSDAIVAAAKNAFLQGANWAYAAGIVAILVGAAITWWRYPDKAQERAMLAEYERQDEPAKVP